MNRGQVSEALNTLNQSRLCCAMTMAMAVLDRTRMTRQSLGVEAGFLLLRIIQL